MALLSRVARAGWGSALDLLYPRHCMACSSEGAFLCASCRASLIPALPPRCERCWEAGSPLCHNCSDDPVLDGMRSAFVYEGPVRHAVVDLKYEGVHAAAEQLAGLMAEALDSWNGSTDVIVPVPLHRSRRRSRGYNQSALLARAYARRTGLLVDESLLIRTRATVAQASGLSHQERLANVHGAFAARQPERVKGRAILLIDDVVTTGATIKACARALREADASAVYGLSFARQGGV